MLNYILDTIYEFWQYMKPHGNFYIAGIKYYDKYIIVRIIPENVALPENYEQLTQPMPKAKAEQRLTHFDLIHFTEKKGN